MSNFPFASGAVASAKRLAQKLPDRVSPDKIGPRCRALHTAVLSRA